MTTQERIYNAAQGTKISVATDHKRAEVVNWIIQFIRPNENQLGDQAGIDFISDNLHTVTANITVEELKLAFELVAAGIALGELKLYGDKFGLVYIGEVVKSYKAYKRQNYKSTDTMAENQEVSKIDMLESFERFSKTWKETGRCPYLTFWHYYEELVKAGKLKADDYLKYLPAAEADVRQEYHDKMHNRQGEFNALREFIRNLTPDNSRVINRAKERAIETIVKQ